MRGRKKKSALRMGSSSLVGTKERKGGREEGRERGRERKRKGIPSKRKDMGRSQGWERTRRV